jgi:flagellar biosynthesis/type III secretory pathway chaperone
MDPALTRDSLERIVGEQLATLTRLEELLEREHALLVDRDVEQLAAAGRDRQACVGALLRIDSERAALCRMFGHAADSAGMQKLLASCDTSGRLATRWQSCTEMTRRCRKLNDRNGALATAQLRSVSGRLDVLTGGAPRSAATYSSGGTARPSTGRLLAANA